MRIGIASDHAGFELKQHLLKFLKELLNLDTVDFGCASANESVDYPDFAQEVCKEVLEQKIDRGILICGSGVGMSIAANRNKGIRSALINDLLSARLCREHNDSNVLCFGSWIVSPKMGEEILKIWLNTQYAGGRHQRRIDKLDK